MKLKTTFVWLAGAIVCACTLAVFPGCHSGKRVSQAPLQGPLPLTAVRSWAIQIQDVEAQGAVDALMSSRYDLIVVEPTRTDWSDAATKNFDTAGMVAQIKGSTGHDGVHRKLVLASINLGEAEAWRFYWTWSKQRENGAARPADWPAFILEPGAGDTGDDHPVAFWDPAWKAIVFSNSVPPGQAANAGLPPGNGYLSLIDEALRDGFDGVYLDWVEAYADERVAAAAQKEGRDPAAEMTTLLAEIRKYATARNPNFLILQGNGSDLILDHPEAANLVDAIVQEGLWYSGATDAEWDEADGHDQPVDAADTEEWIANLKLYRKAGKPVFDLEYAVKNAAAACKKSRANGLVPYCSRAALNQLNDTGE